MPGTGTPTVGRQTSVGAPVKPSGINGLMAAIGGDTESRRRAALLRVDQAIVGAPVKPSGVNGPMAAIARHRIAPQDGAPTASSQPSVGAGPLAAIDDAGVSLQPNRIPQRIITNTLHKPRAQRIGDDVPRRSNEVFFLAQRVIMVTGLP